MKKIGILALIAALAFMPFTANATTSTINPNVPAQNSALSSAVLRANFQAAVNDINNLWTAVTTIFTPNAAGLVPASGGGTTNFLRADGVFAAPSGGGGGGSGTVTSVGLTMPSILTVTGSPVTTAGTLAANLASQAQNSFLAGPTSGSGTPAFRAITAADVPTLNQNTTGTAANITGVASVVNGGTGTTTPSIVAGSNVTVSGTWPNQTISSTASGGGGGTVTSVGVTTANGVSGTVANATTTPAITLTLGAITPSSIAASGAITAASFNGVALGTSGSSTTFLNGAGTYTTPASGSQASNGDSNYTIPSTASSVITTTVLSAARTWTLPAASAYTSGRALCINDLAGATSVSFPLTITAAGSDVIGPEAATTTSLNNSGQGICLLSNGSNAWNIPREPFIAQSSIGMSQDAFNCTPQNTSHIRKSIANAKSGNANGNWLFLGDSTTYGSWSGPGGIDTGDLVSNSMPNKFAEIASESTAITFNPNNFAGGGVTGNEVRSSTDPRLSFGGGWTVASNSTLGGGLIALTNQSTTDTLTFTPTSNVDTFKVYYAKLSSGAVMSLTIDSGTPTNVSTNNGTTTFGSSIVTAPSGVGPHVLKINYVSGTSGQVFITAIQAYNSQKTAVNIITAGAPGITVAGYVSGGLSQPYSPITLMGQDVTFVELGLNDMVASVSAASYKASMQTIITSALAGGGDVVLIPPNTQNTVTASVWQSYVEANRSLATSNNVCMIDTASRWVSWTTANALGFMNIAGGSALHPSLQGYSDEAQTVYNIVGKP
jgi:hypothetical protein